MDSFLKKSSAFILSIIFTFGTLDASVGHASQAAVRSSTHFAWVTGVAATMTLVVVTTIAVLSANEDIPKNVQR